MPGELKILEKDSFYFDYAIGVQDRAFIPVPFIDASHIKVWLGKATC